MRHNMPTRTCTHQGLPIKRILKTRDFRRAYATGRSALAGFLKIYVAENVLEYPRIGIVVGKRVSKKAVFRNRIKRIIRPCANQLLPGALRGPYDIVIIVRPGIKHENASPVLRDNLKTILDKWPF
jgi:ribonuclease P protein component